VSLVGGIVGVILGIVGSGLGIPGLLLSILGLLFGIVGLVNIRKSGGQVSGMPIAIAGTVASGIGVLLGLTLGLTPNYSIRISKSLADGTDSSCKLKRICEAARSYAASHEGDLPPAATWPQALKEMGLPEEVFTDLADSLGERSFAMNSHLGGKITVPVPALTVLFFECKAGSPPLGTQEILPKKPRHLGYSVGFCDGRVEPIRPECVRYLIWNPADPTPLGGEDLLRARWQEMRGGRVTPWYSVEDLPSTN
jgi:hypothetical protein